MDLVILIFHELSSKSHIYKIVEKNTIGSNLGNLIGFWQIV